MILFHYWFICLRRSSPKKRHSILKWMSFSWSSPLPLWGIWAMFSSWISAFSRQKLWWRRHPSRRWKFALKKSKWLTITWITMAMSVFGNVKVFVIIPPSKNTALTKPRTSSELCRFVGNQASYFFLFGKIDKFGLYFVMIEKAHRKKNRKVKNFVQFRTPFAKVSFFFIHCVLVFWWRKTTFLRSKVRLKFCQFLLFLSVLALFLV